jgi:transglutaminase-like putative cysteine protease
MLIRIDHRTGYAYDEQARALVQKLRLTPAGHGGQLVQRWTVDIDCDAHLRESSDAFGNIVHMLYIDRPVGAITLDVSGQVRTSDTAGVLQGTFEPLPPGVYLRETPLSAPDAAIVDFARGISHDGSALDQLHRLLGELHARIRFDTDASLVNTTAAQAFAAGAGVCQDLAHIFIAAARLLGFPARYVSGHLCRRDGQEQQAMHAWAEVLVDGIGWIGFDPAHGISPDEAYVRVAIGLDYRDAAPVVGARQGGSGERLTVDVAVRQSGQQGQAQSQTQG